MPENEIPPAMPVDHSLAPQVGLELTTFRLTGFSKEVDIVQNGILLQREETDSCFYEFRTTNDGDHLLCIFELAVFSFDEEGKKEWSFYAPDIITGYTLENGRFCVKTESGDFRIALATGAYRFQGDS